VVADNGNGTADLPPVDCNYISPDDVYKIIDGLPAGTTIEMVGILMDFICCDGPSECSACSLALDPAQCETTGGSLGGNGHCFTAALGLTVSGTGLLEGFNRHLSVPVFGEVHTGPRTPGDPVQAFPTDMYRLQGELFGDPDFCEFIFIAGTDNGLPGPGQTTLYKLPDGNYAVDSFFDITYQIQFEGCPGSVLDGMMGTTTDTIYVETGGHATQPTCTGGCPECKFCDEKITTKPNGTKDICCDCVPDADLNGDGIVDWKDFAIMANQWLRVK